MDSKKFICEAAGATVMMLAGVGMTYACDLEGVYYVLGFLACLPLTVLGFILIKKE